MTTILRPLPAGFHLAHGAHDSFETGACLLEAVAYVAGEPFSDHPECVCPVLAAFGRTWNDALDDEARNRLLKPFIPRLIGTRSTPDVQDARAFMAADWAVRTFAPVWLRAAGLETEAAELEQLSALSSVELCKAAMPVIDRAKVKAATWDAARAAAWAATWAATWAAARDTARDAAWDAAWAAAGAAARDATWDAAGFATGDATGDAAGAAAWAAAGAAAGAAARAAAWDATWDAAGAAARDATGDAAGAAAWAAARAATWAALRPHVELLQTSAADLYDRMINLTEVSA